MPAYAGMTGRKYRLYLIVIPANRLCRNSYFLRHPGKWSEAERKPGSSIKLI
jgi:hypothetical protein